MDRRVRVVLYGQSVLLGGLAASLRQRPQLEVIFYVPSLEKAVTPELGALAPDVILFDSGSGLPEAVFSLLHNCPGLQVIGIDPSKNQATLWAVQSLSEMTMNDLVRTLLAH